MSIEICFQSWLTTLKSLEKIFLENPRDNDIKIRLSHHIRQAYDQTGWFYLIINDSNPELAWKLFVQQYGNPVVLEVFKKYLLGFPNYLRDPTYDILLCRPKDGEYTLKYSLHPEHHRAIYQWFLENGLSNVVPATFHQ